MTPSSTCTLNTGSPSPRSCIMPRVHSCSLPYSSNSTVHMGFPPSDTVTAPPILRVAAAAAAAASGTAVMVALYQVSSSSKRACTFVLGIKCSSEGRLNLARRSSSSDIVICEHKCAGTQGSRASATANTP